jgi:hypothetical protein
VDGLSPEFLDGYAERCHRLLTAEYPSDVAGELMWLISEPANITRLPGSVYLMWAELTDAWDAGGTAERSRADEFMRRAAEEFLAFNDPAEQLRPWAEEWLERVRSDTLLWVGELNGDESPAQHGR